MKQGTLAAVGITVTALLMILLAYTVFVFVDDPNDPVGMMAMAAVSTGMMTFLVIFGVVYTKPKSDSERFVEKYGDQIYGDKKE